MQGLKSILPSSWIKSAAGRLFIDTTEMSRFERWWDKLRNNPFAMDPETTKATIEVLERNKEVLKEQRKPLIKIIPDTIFQISPSFYKFLLTSIPKTLYGVLFSPEKVIKKAYKFGEKQIDSLRQKIERLNTREEKIAFIKKDVRNFIFYPPTNVTT